MLLAEALMVWHDMVYLQHGCAWLARYVSLFLASTPWTNSFWYGVHCVFLNLKAQSGGA